LRLFRRRRRTSYEVNGQRSQIGSA
jgi:hypothetical protein